MPRRIPSLIAIVLLSLFSFQIGNASPSTPAAVQRPLDNPNLGHPRLLISAAKFDSLRAGLNGSHAWLWERYCQDLPHMVAAARAEHASNDQRYEGDLAIELAFAWRMTGSDSLRDLARSHLLKLTDPKAWEAPEDLIYLIGSHFLIGIGLAYDWMYDELSPQERAQIVACLAKQAEAQFESIDTGRIWWRNQYYQNHSHSNYCGLAFAAAALYGEDERAAKWLGACEPFFEKIFSVMPPDGSSVEGYAYAGYGAEYLLNYAMLSRELLGKDYTTTPWMQHLAAFLVQGVLPSCTAERWAMTFGDGPQRGWSSTAQHLFLLANLYRDSQAQWMARFTTTLRPTGLGGRGWMMLLYYDPSVPEADPKDLPTFSQFPEIGQAMLRSSWTDTAATLIGFKCGPAMSLSQAKNATFDWGTGHAEPDAGSFQIFSHGQFLATGGLYLGYKRSLDFNEMLFKGRGELGSDAPGFGSAEALKFGHYPLLVTTSADSLYDLSVGDVTSAYHPALGLKRYLRRLLFLKPDILLVADRFELADTGILYNYPGPQIQTGGGLGHNDNGQVSGTDGEAWVTFDGKPGTYQIYLNYLDNEPGKGDYCLTVDSDTVHSWKSDNFDRDDNLLEVSPSVELKKGSRITFHGANLPAEFRMNKIVAFSSTVSEKPSATWQLQLEPQAVVTRAANGLSAAVGGACLDVLPLLPAGCRTAFERNDLLGTSTEPFNYMTLTRVTVEPPLSGGSTTLLNLLYCRNGQTAALKEVRASAAPDGSLEVSFIRQGKKVSLTWNLEQNKVDVQE
ncbi:DUF4962 domain-containing protein [bacterium]|nr:DUF4962 domain-containing protein [bacterium]